MAFRSRVGVQALIQCTSLTKKFGQFTAVDQVTFEVANGEVFGLLGPNGAGKTTTMRLLSTLLKPTSGTARLRVMICSASLRKCVPRSVFCLRTRDFTTV